MLGHAQRKIVVLVGWTGPAYYVTALSVGAIVCIASSNGGTTSQDLKTGFLVGATPKSQQIAIVIGALVSALVLGPILLKLNDAATVHVPRMSKEPVAGGTGTALRDVENFRKNALSTGHPREFLRHVGRGAKCIVERRFAVFMLRVRRVGLHRRRAGVVYLLL